MFIALSNQATLLALFKAYTTQERDMVLGHLNTLINALNLPVDDLLDNRRKHGLLLPALLLPKATKQNNTMSDKALQALSTKELLLNQSYLIQAINTFCLSEAVLVRDNFSNCIEIFMDIEPSPITVNSVTAAQNENIKSSENKDSVEKNNVSPIRLTAIKQRLAQAAKDSADKQAQIKNRLNSLLTPAVTVLPTDKSKQA